MASERARGIALMLTSSSFNQIGAGVGALAFGLIGPVGVVAVRQLVTASVLVPVVRPNLHALTRGQWRSVALLAVAVSLMNLTLYLAVQRVGLGLAVTLEFLGPLGVAIASSRRLRDAGCAALALLGVILLTNPGPTTDVLGISFALIAACCWASYILLNRNIGASLPGITGTATTSLIAGVVWLPIAIVWFTTHPIVWSGVALAAACAVLASVIPFSADLLALRRVPANVFATFTSLNPVWAAVVGFLMLGQLLSPWQWLGVGIIVASNVVVTMPRRPS